MQHLSIYFGRLILIVAISLIFIPGTYAKMYKWVDAEGNTQYTQQPPPGDIEAEVIKPPPKVDTDKAQKQLDEQQKQLDNIRKTREEEAEEQQKKGNEVAVRESNCALAKDKLGRLNGNPRVYSVDADGVRTRLSEDVRQAKLAEARKMIKEYCK
jgi:hypothetical protein